MRDNRSVDEKLHRLNDYAARVVPYLVAAFPQHAERIGVDSYADDLELEIECPSQSVRFGLGIRTSAEQIEISFDTSHADFSDWYGDGTDNHIHEAMEAAHDVIAERLVAIAWYDRQGMAAGTLDTPENALAAFHRSQQAALRRSQTVTARIKRRLGLPPRQLPRNLGGNYDQGRVTLRSWNGSHDADSAADVF